MTTLQQAIAVFDKSASRTTPNAQTEAWAVIRPHLAAGDALAAALENAITERERAIALLRFAFAHLEDMDDAGPYLEGWQSDGLIAWVNDARAVLAKATGADA